MEFEAKRERVRQNVARMYRLYFHLNKLCVNWILYSDLVIFLS